jgi:hypothetical protein
MDPTRYFVCLWPGLPELWYRGRWSALFPAICFAIVINFLVVARFIYPEWLVPALSKLACWVGLAVWAVLIVRAVGRLPGLLHPRSISEQPDRYGEAREQYLRGELGQTEALLAGCLEVDHRDSPALLMLAGVYRQTGRWEAAENTLRTLDRLETADGWWLERAAELKKLERAKKQESKPEAEISESEGVINQTVENAAEMAGIDRT